MNPKKPSCTDLLVAELEPRKWPKSYPDEYTVGIEYLFS